MEIKIFSDDLSAEALHEELKNSLGNPNNVELVLQKTRDDVMALDPAVLIAIISSASSVLAAIITGLFSVKVARASKLNAKDDDKKKQAETTPYIVIVKYVNGDTLPIQNGTTKEQIQIALETYESSPVEGLELKFVEILKDENKNK